MTLPVNFVQVERYWFLTWTTYGTWLPGDERGYIGIAPDETGMPVNHNQFGMPAAPPNQRLNSSAKDRLKCDPIVFGSSHANALFEQFQETTQFRKWLLIATGIMRTHLHVIVGVPGDPDPEKILGDLKAYGTRRLNKKWTKPTSETWWTTGGSKRKLPDEMAVEAAINYIRQQPNPLLVWTREEGFLSV